MKKVIIAQTEIITGTGNTLSTTWQNLCMGKSGVKKIEHFDVSSIDFKLASTVNISRSNIISELIKKTLSGMNNIPENTFVIWTGIKGNTEALENGLINPVLPSYYRKVVCDYLNIKNNGLEM